MLTAKTSRRLPVWAALLAGLWCAAALGVTIAVPDNQAAWDILALQADAYPLSAGDTPFFLLWLAKLRLSFSDMSWAWGAGAAGLAVLFYRIAGRAKPRLWQVLLSAVFGVVQVLSLSIWRLDDWSFVTANGYQVLLSVLCMGGYALLMLFAMQGLGLVLALPQLRADCAPAPTGKAARLWAAHTGLCAAGVIVLGWLPWLYACRPGSVSWDSAIQINQFFASDPYDAHHPVLSTLLHGWCFLPGKLLGINALGPFLYVLLQTVVCVYAYTQVVLYMKKLGLRPGAQLAAAVFFGFAPMFGAYAQVVIKDTLFTGVFALFILRTVELLSGRNAAPATKTLVRYCLLALLTSLLRHNGSYAALPCAVLTLAVTAPPQKRSRTIAAVAAVALLAGYWGFGVFSQTVLHISKGTLNEALSVPFQQTARYLKAYGDSVTPEEQAAIDAVLEYDRLAEEYKPYISDPVKALYRNPTGADLAAYFKVWLQMFFKHPDCYFQAFNAGSYGYYAVAESGLANVKEQYFLYIYNKNLAPVGLETQYASPTGTLRYMLYNWALLFDRLPLLGLVQNRGFNTWLLATAGIYLAMRRRKMLIPLLGLTLLLLTCMASPVNDLLRYYMPILACVPILLGEAWQACRPAAATQCDVADAKDEYIEPVAN